MYPAKELIIPGRLIFFFLEIFLPLNPGNEIFQKNENYFLALHLLLAQNGAIHDNMNMSKESWDNFKKHQDSRNLIKMMEAGISLKTKANFVGYALIQELPILLKICEPMIRSVNPALWSKSEKGTA